MGFNIVSIANLDDGVPTQDLQPFVSVKRLTTQQRRKYKQPPPATRCLVQFDPSSQGTAHIRFIQGESEALDAFMSTEAQHPPGPPRSAMQPIQHELLPLNGARRRKRRLAQRCKRFAQHLLHQGGYSQQRLPHRHQHDPPDAHTLTSSTS
jgi:hypothetical protein